MSIGAAVIQVSGASLLSTLGVSALRHPAAVTKDNASKHKTTRGPKRIRAPQNAQSCEWEVKAG